jgi:hypothetical protein
VRKRGEREGKRAKREKERKKRQRGGGSDDCVRIRNRETEFMTATSHHLSHQHPIPIPTHLKELDRQRGGHLPLPTHLKKLDRQRGRECGREELAHEGDQDGPVDAPQET